MLDVALWGLLAAIVLLNFSETVMEGFAVRRWRRRGGPNRLEDWQERHAVVAAVGILVAYGALAWALRTSLLPVVMAAVSLGQHRSLVRVHRRWHAGEFAVDAPAM